MVCSTSDETAASVKTKPSIVAMSGAIMPLPFAMPTTLTVVPSMSTWADEPLAKVSVVRIAFAAASQLVAELGVRWLARLVNPSARRSSGRVSPMTPVDARCTDAASTSKAAAIVSAVSLAEVAPAVPVNALALPLLHTTARAVPLGRIERLQSTGADGQSDLVKTPATVVPSSRSAVNRSARFW